MLLVNLVFPVQLWSKNLCFNEQESKKLLVEIKYNQVTTEKLNVCFQQYSTSKSVINNANVVIDGLQKDKKIITEISEAFKTKYIQTNTDLSKCNESKPSRLTWFGIGFSTAFIVSIVSIFLITK